MIAILIIIGVVTAISLYDFLNTRNWQQVTSPVRNETVFENRNRNYGAYQIRKNYNRNLLLILAGLTGGVGVIYGAASHFREPYRKQAEVIVDKFDTTILVLKKDELPEIKVKEVVDDSGPKDVAQVTKFNDPVATSSTTEPKPDIPEPGNNIGTFSQDGKPGGFDEPQPPGNGGTGNGGNGNNDDNTVHSSATLDEEAGFPGGAPARELFLRTNLRYPEIPLEEGRGGKSYVKFIVRKTGSVDEVTIARKNTNCPECDKEAVRVVRLMPNWTPGKKKGRSVDSYFNLPLTFTPN